ncbi:hypothetical protein DFJ63DRAFT_312530 [Scheffersomyces coipomensis]|uniref:uncharacterized protein n=1 Tax=Scheffersomyces coipomensis TaxID=1788519 RepID=UPI00315D9AC0
MSILYLNHNNSDDNKIGSISHTNSVSFSPDITNDSSDISSIPRSCINSPAPSSPVISTTESNDFPSLNNLKFESSNYLSSALRKTSIDSYNSTDETSVTPSTYEEVKSSTAISNWVEYYNSRLTNLEGHANIKLISSNEDLLMLLKFYYHTRFELQDVHGLISEVYEGKLFPYLHGLNSISQRNFFTNSSTNNEDIVNNVLKNESIFNMMFINSSEVANIVPNLINTVQLNDLLTPNRVQRRLSPEIESDCEVKEIEDIEVHIEEDEIYEKYETLNHIWQLDSITCHDKLNNRNYKDQIRLMAPVSNFVIYNYDRNEDGSIKVAHLIDSLKNEHRNQIIYVVDKSIDWNLIDMEYFDNPGDYDSILFQNQLIPNSFAIKNPLASLNINYSCKLLRYEQQMIWKLNSMKRILGGRICLGNIIDFSNFSVNKYSNFKLIINCHEKASFPTLKTLNSIFAEIESPSPKNNVYYLEFPSAGCLKTSNLSGGNILSFLKVLKLIEIFITTSSEDIFIFSYDGFTGLSVLAISIMHYLKFHSMEDSILFLLGDQEKDIKLYYFKNDIIFLKQFEKFIEYLKRNPDAVSDSSATSIDFQKVSSQLGLRSLHSGLKYDWFKLNQDNNFPAKIYNNLFLGSINHANSLTILDAKKIENIISIGECPTWFKYLRNSVFFDFELGKRRVHQRNAVVLEPIYRFNQTEFQPGAAIYEVNFDCLYQDIRKSPKLPKYIKSMIYIHNLNDDGKDSILPLLMSAPPVIQSKILLGTSICVSPTLVHCRIGVSRSASLVIASVMKHFRLNLLSSYLYVRVSRFNIIVQPNLKIFYELYLFEQYLDLKQQRNGKIYNWEVMCHEIDKLNNHYMG